MNSDARAVYIISDLHVGGRPPAGGDPTDRGFRMFTRGDALTRFITGLCAESAAGARVELVINGDFVDFLAEEHEDAAFLPFLSDPRQAAEVLTAIAGREAALFAALRALVNGGARLTILLGNHDLELSFPLVRARLRAILGASDSGQVTFLYDGEAYVVGDALIEHGNRYDGFNVVDHDALRRVRSLQSRHQEVPPHYAFEPPPGSRLVASIMNPVKQLYPFVDLLKPETEAVIPILLALSPGFRDKAVVLLRLKREADRHAPVAPAEPVYGSDIAASGPSEDAYGEDLGGAPAEDELAVALSASMGKEAAARFASGVGAGEEGSGDIASLGAGGVWGLVRLVTGKQNDDLDRRLPALLEALRVVQHDRSFDPGYETVPAYEEAARALAERGFRYVIFGHTHLAKHIDLGGGKAYFNSGTWADLLKFPKAIVHPENPDPLADLRAFVDDLAHKRFASWIHFAPTYVRLSVEGERVTQAELCSFT